MRMKHQLVVEKALDMGFNLVGVTPAKPSPMLDRYFEWISSGMHGTMGYMARPDRQQRRRDLRVIMPEVASMILVGVDYHSVFDDMGFLDDPSRGRIASYAWGLDYHDIVAEKLESFAEWLQQEQGQFAHRIYVDTGAILERSHAQQAGMGFIGKNTMLIHPRRGSYFFLGEILVSQVFDHYDEASQQTMCGTCTRCLDDCPTDAFPKPHVLDARRCISYLTIEHKGWIEQPYRQQMGNWIFGCDICQDVCPWQRFTHLTKETSFQPVDVAAAAPRIFDLLQMTDARFREIYRGRPIERIKRDRLVRNACIAAGNWANPMIAPMLESLMADESPLVRSHAAWAYARIVGPRAKDALSRLHKIEPNSDAKQDIETTLETL